MEEPPWESPIWKKIELIFVEKIRPECIDLVDEQAISAVEQFIRTRERVPNKFVECMGGYDEIARLAGLL